MQQLGTLLLHKTTVLPCYKASLQISAWDCCSAWQSVSPGSPVFSAKKARPVIPVSQYRCPFSHGRAHFGGFSAHELNGQHMGRT